MIPLEARCAARAVVEHVGPCYLRLGKAGESEVHKRKIDFKIGKAVLFRDGSDVTLISTGGMLQTAARVADALARQGIEARVLSMHTLKPLDTESVLAAARDTGALFTLESPALWAVWGAPGRGGRGERHLSRPVSARWTTASVFASYRHP